MVYLYSLPDCPACERAKALLHQQGLVPIVEVGIDNPLVEVGVKMLFHDGLIHSPVVIIPGNGAYVLNEGLGKNAPPELHMVVSLAPESGRGVAA